jgi:hypothetical protein
MHLSFQWPRRKRENAAATGCNGVLPCRPKTRLAGTSTGKPEQPPGNSGTFPIVPTQELSSMAAPSASEDQDSNDESPYGIKIVVNRREDSRGCVDIIAIHGLNGHRDKTWTDRTTGLNWLSDPLCIRKDIPNARVLTFGYNAKTYFSRSGSDVRDFASELLVAVKSSRRTRIEQLRPIIFICHSLGGLVFKQVSRCTSWDYIGPTTETSHKSKTHIFRQSSELMSKTSFMPTF